MLIIFLYTNKIKKKKKKKENGVLKMIIGVV